MGVDGRDDVDPFCVLIGGERLFDVDGVLKPEVAQAAIDVTTETMRAWTEKLVAEGRLSEAAVGRMELFLLSNDPEDLSADSTGSSV